MPTIRPLNGQTSIIPTMFLTEYPLSTSSYLNHEFVYAFEAYGTEDEIKLLKSEIKEGKDFFVRANHNASFKYNYRMNLPSGDANSTFIYHEEQHGDVHQLFAFHRQLEPSFGEAEKWEQEQRKNSGVSERRPKNLRPIVFCAEEELQDRIWDMMQHFNTPMLPEWKDVLIDRLRQDEMIEELHVSYFNYRDGSEQALENGYKAVRLAFSEYTLEKTITDMIHQYEIPFALDAMHDSSVFDGLNNLTSYIERFAPDLARSVQEKVQIMFDPSRDKHHGSIRDLNLFANQNGLTGMFAPQADTVMSAIETLDTQSFNFLSGEMGVGKTLMGSVIPFVHAKKHGKQGYRAIVLSPKILLQKWERELKLRIPDVKVFQVSTYEDLVHLHDEPKRPDTPEYYIISQTAFKTNYPVQIAAKRHPKPTSAGMLEDYRDNGVRPNFRMVENVMQNHMDAISVPYDGYACPSCGHVHSETHFHTNGRVENASLSPSNKKCVSCKESLWTVKDLPAKSKLRKVSPAWYINKRFPRGFFEYLLVDEAHEYKSGATEIGKALGQLINHCSYKVMMTGTLFGGNATDLFYLLARLNPRKLKQEGMTYHDENTFHRNYGVTEAVTTFSEITEKFQTRKKRRPGINPTLYPMHLMPSAVFLEIADLGFALPPYQEEARFVELDSNMRAVYNDMFTAATQFHNAVKSENLEDSDFPEYNPVQVLNQINGWLDRPYRTDKIGLRNRYGQFHTIYKVPEWLTDPRNNKLTQLYADIDAELEQGRKTLVYVKDVDGANPELGLDIHLYQNLLEEGYNVGILRSGGPTPFGGKFPTPENREKWLRKMQEKNGWDVLITNPSLVKVGLDLYDYPTILFYQYGMSSFEYMQAARRSWRIGQTKDVKVITYAYQNTPQQSYLEMLASKIDAALTIQGKLTEDGLRSLSESTSDLAQLAKSIMEGDALTDVETVHERFKRINKMTREGTIHDEELYKDYEQNPIEGGVETVELIRLGMYKPKEEVIEAEFTEVAPVEEPTPQEKAVETLLDKETVMEDVTVEIPPVVEVTEEAEEEEIDPILYDEDLMFESKAVRVKRKATKKVVEIDQFELPLF